MVDLCCQCLSPVRSVSMAVIGSHVISYIYIYVRIYIYTYVYIYIRICINGLEPCLPPSYDSWDDPNTDCPRKYSM